MQRLYIVGLQEILKAMYRFVELRAVSSYLIAVVAVMKRCRACLFYLSSTAFVTLNFYPSTCERSFPCWPRDMLPQMSVV